MNVAVFVALAHVTDEPLLAAVAFLTLAAVLAVDFNITELYREAHEIPTIEPSSSGTDLERSLAFLYRIWFGVLDRVVRGISTWRFGDRPAYDGFAVTVLANLGLTTQLAVLGVCLALGAPTLYLWLVLGCLLVLGALHVRAEVRVRDAF